MERNYKSPRIANWLLRRMIAVQIEQQLMGDFEEAYRDYVQEYGRTQAILWYWGQILCSLPSLIHSKIYWGAHMLKNYIKIAFRNLLKHKGYSFINILGLAIGMACCIIILLYVKDELSYDNFHEKGDRLYRLTLSTTQDQPTNANTSFSQGPAMAEAFPEVASVVRFRKMGWGEKRVFANGDNRFYEEQFFFTDPNVFEVFSFPMIAGNPKTALTAPYSLVLSESMAEKYFAGESALGKTISADPYNDGDFTEFKITGVFKDIPHNSHIKFDFLASFKSQKGRMQSWGLDPVFTYVLLKPGHTKKAVEARLPALLEKNLGDRQWYTLHLQPLADIRLHSRLRAELEPNGDINYIYIFSAIAAFILLIACINFMNLATARSSQRAKEVGMRKVLGAVRGQLVKQFLGEAVLLSIIAVGIAFILIELLLPVLNDILGKAIEINYISDVLLVQGMCLLALLTGVLAGSYPAFFLSAFRPVDTLKGSRGSQGDPAVLLRKGLVVFQFTISIILIACTAVVWQQMEYVRSKNLGFARDQILIAPLNNDIRSNYKTVKNALLDHHGVQAMGLSEQVPAKAGNGAQYTVEGLEQPVGITRFFVDHDFLKAYDIEVVAGRGFSEEFSTDASEAFLLNETFVNRAEWASPDEALGRAVQMQHARQNYNGKIIGVVKDFHLSSFRNALSSLAINIMPIEKLNFISFRISTENVSGTLDHLQEAWQTFAPGYPFDYYFLDDDFARLHQADEQLGQVFQYFAFLAIFVACLGLFGLAAFTAERRTKEIGIRKVLGASVGSIVLLLSREFTRWVIFANIIAWPAAYLMMEIWLQDFAYKINVGVGVFLFSAAAALLIAIVTVSLQTMKAAIANPIKSIRYE